MRAKKCDRCFNFFEPKKLKNIDLCFISPSKSGRSLYRHHMDLCPDCDESLEEWFNEFTEIGVYSVSEVQNTD